MRHRTLLLLLLLLFLPRLKTHPPGQGNTVALKDGTAPQSSPKTALTSLLNPRKTIVLDKVLWFSTNFYTTVSTMRHRTLLLLLLLLLLLFLPRLKMHPPGQGNTVALKDGTAPKSSPKTA